RFVRSARWGRIASVVVPPVISTLAPLPISAAAASPIRRFSSSCSRPRAPNTGSPVSSPMLAPPCTRVRRPRSSRGLRSRRTVDDPAAGDVDEDGARLDGAYGLLVHEAGCVVGEGDHDDDVVAAAEDLVEPVGAEQLHLAVRRLERLPTPVVEEATGLGGRRAA